MNGDTSLAKAIGGMFGFIFGYLGHLHGPPYIYNFGAVLLGAYIGTCIGFHIIAVISPISYIELWNEDGFPIPLNIIPILPIISIIAIYLIIEPPRVHWILDFDYSYWSIFLSIGVLSSLSAIIRLFIFMLIEDL